MAFPEIAEVFGIPETRTFGYATDLATRNEVRMELQNADGSAFVDPDRAGDVRTLILPTPSAGGLSGDILRIRLTNGRLFAAWVAIPGVATPVPGMDFTSFAIATDAQPLLSFIGGVRDIPATGPLTISSHTRFEAFQRDDEPTSEAEVDVLHRVGAQDDSFDLPVKVEGEFASDRVLRVTTSGIQSGQISQSIVFVARHNARLIAGQSLLHNGVLYQVQNIQYLGRRRVMRLSCAAVF